MEGVAARAAGLAKFRDELQGARHAALREKVAITGRVLALDGRTHGDQHTSSRSAT